ncbi:hypothetical protein AZE42_10420 [Rhizopogon vesiculosus]|uniref:Uncharacterized protein n=1 Tax=Rhizopogon vesiculosus TaxID=180088 RepID=A0A1J8QRM9_9AGAM|nr:hypothetical protein AZE42_10420 [Rhizopogon vesiculosus]
MTSEESPSLATRDNLTPETVYDRIAKQAASKDKGSNANKRSQPVFVQATFVPSIPQIAKDLNSTHAVVSLGVGMSIFATAVGALVWAAYSSFWYPLRHHERSRHRSVFPPNRIGHHHQKVAGAAQRNVVSRRPSESDMDRKVVHGTTIHCDVRTSDNICWRSDWSLAEFIVSLYQWNVLCMMSPIGSYNVDVAHSRSAEITAAYAVIRSVIVSAATALVTPSIKRIGVAWTDIIAAVLALVGQELIFLTIRYGDRMRAGVDVGF